VIFFFPAEDGIRARNVTGVQTCALPILAFTSDGIANLNPASIYTLIVIDNNSNKLLDRAYLSDTTGVVNGLVSLHKCSESGTGHPHIYTKDGSNIPDGYMDNVKVILLEGDHTQHTPAYSQG